MKCNNRPSLHFFLLNILHHHRETLPPYDSSQQIFSVPHRYKRMTDHLKANIRYVSPLSAGELTAKSRGSTPALFLCFMLTPFCTMYFARA